MIADHRACRHSLGPGVRMTQSGRRVAQRHTRSSNQMATKSEGAAPEQIPEPLLDQLALGGRMILPLGGENQRLVLLVRDEEGLDKRELLPVRFVPMTGEIQRVTKKKNN